ncbi:MAG: hypothetical protein RLZZ478_774, partial [Actinomycetota bacterium]
LCQTDHLLGEIRRTPGEEAVYEDDRPQV